MGVGFDVEEFGLEECYERVLKGLVVVVWG